MTRAWTLVSRPLVAPSVVRDIAIYLPTGRVVGPTALRVAAFLRQTLGQPQVT